MCVCMCLKMHSCRRSWDFGMYVAVTSSHPLKVYVYNDIVLRFCPAKYVDPVVEPEVCTHTQTHIIVVNSFVGSGFAGVCHGFVAAGVVAAGFVAAEFVAAGFLAAWLSMMMLSSNLKHAA